MKELLEVRWHGLGGMGAVTSSDLIASAAISEGKYAQSFPSFGIERRGAPVVAFLRISDQFVRTRTDIITPDILIVFTANLLRRRQVIKGLKKSGFIIINSTRSPQDLKKDLDLEVSVASVNASKISMETIHLPIYNTAMMGAFQKVIQPVMIESIEAQIKQRFGPRADANIEAMKRAYDATVIEG
jgi:pyruvate ferredoxin oxidoreductase gamma subunit